MTFKKNAEGIVWGRIGLEEGDTEHIVVYNNGAPTTYPIKKSKRFKAWLKASPDIDILNQDHAYVVIPKTLKEEPYMQFYVKYIDLNITEPIKETFTITGVVIYQNQNHGYLFVKHATSSGPVDYTQTNNLIPIKLLGRVADPRAVGKVFVFQAVRNGDYLEIESCEEVVEDEAIVLSGS